jgi:hypothetical protein
MYTWVDTVSSAVTLTRFGVYNSALALVASTTNDATIATTGGMRSKALTSSYITTASDYYYFAYLIVGTPGTHACSGNSPSTSVPRIGSNAYGFFAQSGLADLSDPVVPGSGNGELAVWIGAA